MRDQWIEKLVCPNCRKTGNAELSQTDELSWDVRADSVPDGFNVIQVEHRIEFHCAFLRHPRGTMMMPPKRSLGTASTAKGDGEPAGVKLST
jgi:hypothetical protein